MWQTREVAEAYSKHSLTGTKFVAYRDLPALIKRHVSGSATLDYGCGPGHTTTYLKSLGLNAEGVDTSDHMIRYAKEHDPTGNYKIIKSAEIPTEEQYYDLVLAGMVLVLISTKTEMVGILKEVARVLKKDGTFIAIVSNPLSYYTNEWESTDTNFVENQVLSSGSVVKSRLKDINLTIMNYYWTHEDYHDAMNAAGLNIAEVYEPTGTDNDGIAWISEKEKAPYTLFVAKKM